MKNKKYRDKEQNINRIYKFSIIWFVILPLFYIFEIYTIRWIRDENYNLFYIFVVLLIIYTSLGSKITTMINKYPGNLDLHRLGRWIFYFVNVLLFWLIFFSMKHMLVEGVV
jgi:cytosine/uracil/thiamine/allantoin permease